MGCNEADSEGSTSKKGRGRAVLRLTRVEATVDLKDKGKGVLEGRLQERRMLGASAATPGNDRLLREFKDEGLQGSAHSRVARRLREVQRQGRFK